MNVRFFAGTKADYLSLPTPRNPLGLYFCEDTQELFWADRLLTDGMRVVPTHADLPDCSVAADGVVYYVTETRNGYTLSPDRAEWLQTIYAPATDAYDIPESEIYNTVTTVGAVRDIEAKIYKTIDDRIANIEIGSSSTGVTAIYFAGRKLDAHDDGSYHIDRLCALKALGFIVPDDQEEFELVTKEYVDEQIKALPGVDLEEYAKKTELDGLATEEFVTQKIAEAELNDKDVDLTAYYTKTEVDALIPDVNGFATKDEVDEAIYHIEQDIRSRATEAFVKAEIAKIEIPEVPTKVSELENDAGYITKHQGLDEYAKKSDIPSIEGLATEDFVRSEIAKAELNSGEVTEEELTNLLANYYNKTEVDNKIKAIDIPSIEGLATEQFVKDSIDAIEIPETDLSNYYNKAETETLVTEALNGVVIPDTSNFITMEDVEAKGYLTEHQDISNLATKNELEAAINNIEHPTVDLAGYATEEFVNNVIATINIPEEELYKVDYNAPNFVEATEAYKAGKVLVLINAAPDVNSYALMNYVSDSYITFTKFLTSRSEAYGAFNTYYLSAENTWEVSKEVRLNKVEANVADEPTTELTKVRIGKEVYSIAPSADLSNYYNKEQTNAVIKEAVDSIEIPKINLDGYATEQYVIGKIAEIDIPEVPTKVSELDNDLGYITAIPEDVVTDSELTAKNFATEVYVDKAISNIPPVDFAGYATEDYVNNIANTYKYEVLPIAGMFVQYNDNEVRVNTEHVDIDSLPAQNAGDGSSNAYYYMTFRAYAPNGATSVIEGQNDTMDAEHSELTADKFGRKYTTIWAAIANKAGNAWSKFGDRSTIDKYLGFYYNFHWYKDDDLISKEKVRVILTNDACHNDLVPDAVARRIDEKVSAIKLPEVDLSEYAKLADIPSVDNFITMQDVEDKNYLTKVPEGFATETFVHEMIAKAELEDKEADLEAYYTKEQVDKLIPDVTGFITSIPDEYITETELENKGYLTEHQDISHLVEKSELPDFNEFASKNEIPNIDGYATEEYVNDIAAAKANDILFNTDKFVKVAIGNFVIDENINGYTIAQLFAKLLGLADENTEPTDPEVPSGVIANIMTNQIPMYAITADSKLVEVPYKYISLTEATASEAPEESGFFQIKDATGTVIASGYQELQADSGETYYVIALPKAVDYNTMITLSVYDDNQLVWTDAEKFEFTCDPSEVAVLCDEAGIDISHIDTNAYTVWALNDNPTGSKIRFIINE